MISLQQIRYWSPAFASLACQAISMGVVTVYGFFIAPLSEEFDAGVATLNLAPAMIVLVSAFFAPVVGRWLDRMAIKRIMLIGVFVLVGGLLALSVSPSLQLSGLLFVVFAMGIVLTGPVVNNTLLTKIYSKDLGRALAIAAMGVSISAIVLPLAVAGLLDAYGWRVALRIMAGAFFVIMGGVVLFLIPAGNGSSLAAEEEKKEEPASKQFLRSRNFWFIGLSVAIIFSCGMLLSLIYPPHLESIGFTIKEAALLMSISGVGGFIGKLLVAILADRFNQQLKWLALAFVLSLFSGLVLFVSNSDFAGLLVAIFFIGIGAGGLVPLHPFLNAAYFDTKIIGQVNGAQMPIFLPFTIIGPPLAGLSYDQTGSYQTALVVLIGVLALGATMLLGLGRPQKESS